MDDMHRTMTHGTVKADTNLSTKETRIVDDGDALMFMAQEVKRWCQTKGWWDDGRTFGDEIALIHSELSEALEAYRDHLFEDATVHGAGQPEEMIKPEGVGSELADVLVRLLHTCALHDVDLFAEYRRKMNYNGTRAFRHGGRAL